MHKKLSLANQRDSEANRTFEQNSLMGRTTLKQEDDCAEGMRSNVLGKRVGRFFSKHFADRFDKIERELNRDRRFLVFEKKQTKAYCNFFERLAAELNDKGQGNPDKQQTPNGRVTESGKKESGRDALQRANTIGVSNFEFEEKRKEGLGDSGKKGTGVLEHVEATRSQVVSKETAELLRSQRASNNPVLSKRASVCLTGVRLDELREGLDGKDGWCNGPLTGDSTLMRRKSNLNLTALKLSDFNADSEVLGDSFRASQFSSVSKPVGATPGRDDFKELATSKRANLRQTVKATASPAVELPSGRHPKPDSLKPQPSKDRCSHAKKEDPRMSNRANKTHTLEHFMDEVKSRDEERSKGQERDFDNSFDADAALPPLHKSKTMVAKPAHFIFSPENFVGRKTQNRERELGRIDEKVGEGGARGLKNLVMSEETGASLTSSSKIHKREDSKSDESATATQANRSDARRGLDDLGKSCDSLEMQASQNKVDASRGDKNEAKGERQREADRDAQRVTDKCKADMELELKRFEAEEKEKLAREEELLREKAEKAQKKLKKDMQLKLKQRMHSLILTIMSPESKLPSLFLNIKSSDAFMLLESVNVSLLSNISAVESEIAGIKEQYPELREFAFETLEDDYPFTVSPLSILSLKTVSESELKEVLVCEKLSSDILNVLRVFYFVHFDQPEFIDFAVKGQKQTIIEIEEFYSQNLRDLDKDQKLFRYLDFEQKVKLEQFLKTNKSLFSVVSDMTLKPFLHSLCFYTFEILFYYGMKPYVKFMEKPKARENNVMHSAYQLNYLLSKAGFHRAQLEEFTDLKNQCQTKLH